MHTYDASTNTVRTLDLVAPWDANLGNFVEIAPAVTPADQPGAGPQLIVTPDGGNLILADFNRVLVLPAP